MHLFATQKCNLTSFVWLKFFCLLRKFFCLICENHFCLSPFRFVPLRYASLLFAPLRSTSTKKMVFTNKKKIFVTKKKFSSKKLVKMHFLLRKKCIFLSKKSSKSSKNILKISIEISKKKKVYSISLCIRMYNFSRGCISRSYNTQNIISCSCN